MSDIEVTISLARTGLSLSPLELTGTLSTDPSFGIVRYFPPSYQARTTYAPAAEGVDGDIPLSTSWGQGILGFDWTPVAAADRAAVKAAHAEMLAAIAQFQYLITTTEDGASPEVWRAERGSILPFGSDGLTHIDLKHKCPVYAVTIPVYPIPGGVG